MVDAKKSGGLKGILQRTGKFFYSGGLYAYQFAKVGYVYGGKVAFSVATTSMIVLMPLLFEIAREGQMIETERAQIKDLKSKGYSERQLQEMGFSESALFQPSVASLQAK
ncbi:hypothetical protein FisN_4Hh046 [Fistulifera solaris]|uniref:Uncharacterized protein n=1 Tax=Fistulifera solaris TaxID=1519565 RepID=A0A1Z5KDC6_FISSO|nr:hypothetical protein FisN_4Lh046 [Fistulifera solaris]GAX28384.1 hypothetical protein FisN_4Hh046 [Fistulifera solaris]|eukprot:GAX24253.1 hypothetical protein FisN_4Lh046 [Fistulifera solaris]